VRAAAIEVARTTCVADAATGWLKGFVEAKYLGTTGWALLTTGTANERNPAGDGQWALPTAQLLALDEAVAAPPRSPTASAPTSEAATIIATITDVEVPDTRCPDHRRGLPVLFLWFGLSPIVSVPATGAPFRPLASHCASAMTSIICSFAVLLIGFVVLE